MINDEMTDEQQFQSLSVTRQKELIESYCERMVERIGSAENAENARAILEVSCAQFDEQCVSAMIRSAVRDHAQRMLEDRWGK